MKLRLAVILLLVAGGALATWFLYHPQPKQPISSTAVVKIYIQTSIQADRYKKLLSDYFQSNGTKTEFVDAGEAEISISNESGKNTQTLNVSTIGKPVSLQNGSIVKPLATKLFISTNLSQIATHSASEVLSELASRLNQQNSSNSWSLQAVGDVILGRLVLERMLQSKDLTSPFARTADRLKKTDLTLADLEVTLADGITHSTDLGTLNFSAPKGAIAGLKRAGIDGVNLANNHSYNGGKEAFVKMMDALDADGIKFFGAGKDGVQAHRPAILNVKGVKVALLGYSSIVGSHEAGSGDPGQAYLSMQPWGKWDEARVRQMEADIKQAKTQADLVFAYYHWGTEYTHQANADQRRVAHRAIDAGADLILGTHPHWVQGIEWYHDKLITYSLGNFIFDQKWPETQQGTVLEAKFNGKNLASAELVPYQIANYFQPYFVSGGSGAAILHDIYSHSWWP